MPGHLHPVSPSLKGPGGKNAPSAIDEEQMNRDKMLSFRVNESEREEIKDYLDEKGIKRSPFVREAVFAYMNSDKPQIRREMLNEFKKTRREFANAGNNINQVAYRLNAGHPIAAKDVIETQETLQRTFSEMVRFYRRVEDELRG